MLKWWKAYASLCVFCSAREFHFATKLQLCCAQAACVHPEAKQQGLKAALNQDGDYYAPSAFLAWGLHREQPCALVRSGLLPLLFRIQSSSSSLVQFPWLSTTSPCINWLQSLCIKNFHPIKTKACYFLACWSKKGLLKSWFHKLFTCVNPIEFDADKPALSSDFSGPAQSTAKYRKHIHTGNGLFF